MKNSHTLITTGVLTLLLGLFAGYLIGITNSQSGFSMGGMHGGMMQHTDRTALQPHGGGMGIGSMMFGFEGSDAEYEEAWLAQMIMHHQGAVVMSEALLNRTDRPELKEFAEGIISTQAQEIDTMQGWLDTWFENE